MDQSSGYEAVSRDFLAFRGKGASRPIGVGVAEVRSWARKLPSGSCVLDLGCGSGYPLATVLVEEGLQVFGIDGTPTLVAAFQKNLPDLPVLCEAVQTSRLFNRTFDAVLAWGLVFLLTLEEQRCLLQRVAKVLVSQGRLLFTSPATAVTWNDAMTGLESLSLGAKQYRKLLEAVGLSVIEEYEDQGRNHYFDVIKE